MKIGGIFEELENRKLLVREFGEMALEILKLLPKSEKEAISDKDLSIKLNVKTNHVNNALELMNMHKIVGFVKEVDSKGWISYRWYLRPERLLEWIENERTKIYKEYEKRLEFGEELYFCNICGISNGVYNFEDSELYKFKCPHCQNNLEILTFDDIEVYKSKKIKK
jgi:transcription factor E